jgi:hypothetical protein
LSIIAPSAHPKGPFPAYSEAGKPFQTQGAVAESEVLAAEEGEPVLLFGDSLSSAEVDDDGEYGLRILEREEGVVVKHPPGDILLGSGLDLDVHQDQLRLAFMGVDLGDQIRLSFQAFGEVREELLVQETRRLEVETIGDVGVEELEELPEEPSEDAISAVGSGVNENATLVDSTDFVDPLRAMIGVKFSF